MAQYEDISVHQQGSFYKNKRELNNSICYVALHTKWGTPVHKMKGCPQSRELLKWEKGQLKQKDGFLVSNSLTVPCAPPWAVHSILFATPSQKKRFLVTHDVSSLLVMCLKNLQTYTNRYIWRRRWRWRSGRTVTILIRWYRIHFVGVVFEW